MIHLPFNIAVERGKTNVFALGNVDNKEILIHSIKVHGADAVRIAWATAESIGGGRDVTQFAQSAYLGEQFEPLFDAIASPEVDTSQVVKICQDYEVADEKDGLTIPNGVYLVLNVETNGQARITGTISWDVRQANETF